MSQNLHHLREPFALCLPVRGGELDLFEMSGYCTNEVMVELETRCAQMIMPAIHGLLCFSVVPYQSTLPMNGWLSMSKTNIRKIVK